MYPQQIQEAIEQCRKAIADGASLDEVRSMLLPELLKPMLKSADDFLHWIKDDRESCSYYYEVQHSGVCANPVEAAALILESIILEALDSSAT